MPRKDGTKGPRVLKVNVTTGSPDEYIDMSKDQSGAFRKGKKGHRGQIIYLLRKKDERGVIKERVSVRPVYSFESRYQAEASLREKHGDAITLSGFFQSGCLVSINSEVQHDTLNLPAGIYMLNTIILPGTVKLTNQQGKTYPDIPKYSLSKLMASGFRRYK